jgi:SH3-like domain-containing protein
MAQRQNGKGGVAGFIVLAALIGLSNMRGQHPTQTIELSPQNNQTSQAASPTEVLASQQAPAAQKQTNNSVVTPADGQQSLADLPRRKMFVGVEKLNVRATPDPIGKKTAALAKGLAVYVVETAGGWSKIETASGQTIGWVTSSFLNNGQPESRKSIELKPQIALPTVKPIPSINRQSVITAIIRNSMASWSGNCACPYQTDRGGRRCGGRSAYSRPGGYSPVCFEGDVSNEMIADWVERHKN